jgi:signal transduction histidine kinase/DNA-binding response OmpR family regulator/ligand-binding sensor domain-containing protein
MNPLKRNNRWWQCCQLLVNTVALRYFYQIRSPHLGCSLFIILFPVFLQAQNNFSFPKQALPKPRYINEALSNMQNLQSSDISALFQDEDGFIWIGNQPGVSRYDGFDFTNFSQAGESYIGQIHDIVQDRSGTIWIGGVNGLFFLADGRFYETSLGKYSIRSLHLNDRNDLLIGGVNFIPFYFTSDDLLALKENQPVAEHELVDASVWDNTVIGKNVWQIDIDPSGGIWIGTDYQLLSLFEDRLEIQFEYKDSIPEISAIAAFGPDSVYWGSEDSGAHLLKGDHSKKITAPSTNIFQKSDTSIYFLTTMDILEYHNGLMDTLHVFTTYSHLYFKEMIKDREGNFWIGAQGNLLKFTPTFFYSWTLENHPLLHSNHSIAELPSGDIIIGSSKEKILKFNNHQFEIFGTVDAPHNSVNTAIFPIDEENMWISTSMGGLIKKYNNKQLQFSENKGLGDKGQYFIRQTKNGELWSGGENGISRIIEKNGKFEFQNFMTNLDHEETAIFHTIVESPTGIIWGASDKGLFTIENKQLIRYAFDQPLNPYPIITSAFANEKEVWLSTQGEGLWQCQFNEEGIPKKVKQWTVNDGLISNVVLNVHIDILGRVWSIHQNGVCRITLQKDTTSISTYDKNDGWPEEPTAKYKILESAKGWLWVVGNTSVTTFPLYDLLSNPVKPKIFITNVLLVDGKENIYNYAENDQQSGILPEKLILPHDKNFLRFEFTTTSHTKSAKNSFRYKLEGLEDRWIEGGLNRAVTYSGLAPGAYTFKIKASNNDGLLSPEPAMYSFEILSPWYMRWWAIALFTILTLSLVYLFYRNRLNKRIAQQETLRLQELDSFKNRFYANITHEFRTPLTVIQGMAEELSERLDDAPKKKLGLIRKNSKSLLELINQMLDLSKLQAGHLQLDYRQRDVIAYLRYLVESFESYARSQGLSLQFYSEEKELIMDLDEQKMERILLNLISNAIKFTPEHGKILVVAKTVSTPKGAQLQVLIHDNGIGISKDELPHIFDRYHQVGEENNQYGTGIGLALVKELTNLLEGMIEVESETHKGTDFYLRLPIRRRAPLYSDSGENKRNTAGMEEVLPVTKPSKQNVSSDSEHPILLLIEDNADVAYYIQTCLNEDYQIIHCYDGQSGVEKGIELIPDIIICDVMMPGMNGFAVCQKLKTDERTNHIPIILLTAKASAEDKLVGLQYGADAYLTKPFDKQELRTRLTKLLEIRKTLQAKYSTAIGNVDQRSSRIVIGEEQEQSNNQKHPFLQKVEAIILAQLSDEDLSINELSRQLHLSTSQVYRKIKALSGMSSAIFIRYVRLCQAKELLSENDLSISEVAYRTGFRSPVYFSQAFKETFGESPSAFQKSQL